MDDDQQFCLRWNNHQSTLISVFDTLLENGTLVDCTLAAEGKFLKAHKVVLSACSPYFATLLSQQYDKHPIFILKDVKFQELRAMMDYMYRGEVNISQDQLAALLKAAESLQIKGLSDSRSGGASNTQSAHQMQQKPNTASNAKGFTIEHKRSAKHSVPESDMAGSREGSTSPTARKRKRIRRRSITDANSVNDNHDHSNSSSHSVPHPLTTSTPAGQQLTAVTSVPTSTSSAAGAAANTLNVTKKTDIHDPKHDAADHHDGDDQNDMDSEQADDMNGKGKHSVIEPKHEYDDGNDEPVEDLTLDEEEMLDDLDQPGPSHGGEGSSQGYSQWQIDRAQDDVYLSSQDTGAQNRDAQDDTIKLNGNAFTPAAVKPKTSSRIADREQKRRDEQQQISSSTPIQAGQTTIIGGAAIGTAPPTLNNTTKLSHPRIKYSGLKNHKKSGNKLDHLLETLTAQLTPVPLPLGVLTANTPNILKTQNSPTGVAGLINYADIDDIQLPDGSPIGYPCTNKHDDTKDNDSLPYKNDLDQKYSGAFTANSLKDFKYSSDQSQLDEERPFACQHCGKQYRWKSTLRRHENDECGGKEPSHQCPYCSYKAKQRGNLGVHIRKHHAEMPQLQTRRKKRSSV